MDAKDAYIAALEEQNHILGNTVTLLAIGALGANSPEFGSRVKKYADLSEKVRTTRAHYESSVESSKDKR